MFLNIKKWVDSNSVKIKQIKYILNKQEKNNFFFEKRFANFVSI